MLGYMPLHPQKQQNENMSTQELFKSNQNLQSSNGAEAEETPTKECECINTSLFFHPRNPQADDAI